MCTSLECVCGPAGPAHPFTHSVSALFCLHDLDMEKEQRWTGNDLQLSLVETNRQLGKRRSGTSQKLVIKETKVNIFLTPFKKKWVAYEKLTFATQRESRLRCQGLSATTSVTSNKKCRAKTFSSVTDKITESTEIIQFYVWNSVWVSRRDIDKHNGPCVELYQLVLEFYTRLPDKVRKFTTFVGVFYYRNKWGECEYLYQEDLISASFKTAEKILFGEIDIKSYFGTAHLTTVW